MKRKMKKDSLSFRVALTGIFAALTVTVSLLERLVTATLPLPPGVKPGLGNVAVMLVCFLFGFGYAISIVLIKSLFMLIVSGISSAFISLCGGLLSITAMFLFRRLLKEKSGAIGTSVLGAVLHNTGQLFAASILVGSSLYLSYAPVLLVSAVVCGIITGIILRFTEPAVSKIIR